MVIVTLPFAGGNQHSYKLFKNWLPPHFRLINMEYPGHGARIIEPAMTDIRVIAKDILSRVSDTINTEEYIIYGHSMGAIVGFELAHEIISNDMKAPVRLFMSGASGPSSPRRGERNWHRLSKKDFIEKLKELKGCPEELFLDQELLDFIEPIIRSDFTATESYCYPDRAPLRLPITVVTGDKEPMTQHDIHLWQKESVYEVDFISMPGEHFFIFDEAEKMVRILTGKFQLPSI